MSKSQSLQMIVKDHERKQRLLRDDTQRKKKLALQAIDDVSGSLMDSVNNGVAIIFANQRKIEAQVQLLQQESQIFVKQTKDWLTMIENFNQGLKELGDVENWAKQIEKNMNDIAGALEYVHREKI